jgi:hypothetical protein
MIYSSILSKLSVAAFIVATVLCIYYGGYKQAASHYKLEIAKIQQVELAKLLAAQKQAESALQMYNSSELQRTEQSIKLAQYVAQHKDDINKYNHINRAYISILQHRADDGAAILSPVTIDGSQAVDAVYALNYSLYLYDYGVQCANQLNALESAIAVNKVE